MHWLHLLGEERLPFLRLGLHLSLEEEYVGILEVFIHSLLAITVTPHGNVLLLFLYHVLHQPALELLNQVVRVLDFYLHLLHPPLTGIDV
jgi:hypothetical protein